MSDEMQPYQVKTFPSAEEGADRKLQVFLNGDHSTVVFAVRSPDQNVVLQLDREQVDMLRHHLDELVLRFMGNPAHK